MFIKKYKNHNITFNINTSKFKCMTSDEEFESEKISEVESMVDNFILKNKTHYKDLGNEFLENKKKDKQILHHMKRLKELGVNVEAVA